ncbi:MULTISPECIES: glycosyltransferase [unclassified Methylomonas]|uniref:glycosyltransferase n=1 Tax=unclassified Methylomonas TaxID=2608980 RepID=UPI0008D8F59E|nr:MULTISPECIES: glycosyltransferase [unclassified Methylomonas]NJA04518.1 glycosyltransferase [Methylococcaceae bacterium WWC4]OHX35705.1 cellulose synthase [Methylomonas sp. LWB]WGS85913.1 glycosyltransferase [Methylomonas sp. UP202]
MKAKIATFFSLVFLVAVNLGIWSYINNPLKIPSWNKTMMGLTFSPMRRDSNPREGKYPTQEQIAEDINLLSDKAHSIRTYTALEGMEVVPELAAKNGLNLAMGAWIDDDREKNRREIEALIQLSNQYPKAIVRTLVGNETQIRKNVEIEELIEYIREVKKRTWKPVSTAETWDVWEAHPELVAEVDYIGVHILPYWEGIPIEEAVDYVFMRYHELQAMYPGKQIVISEVGWPSDGQPYKHSTASLANQAKFLRGFLNRATEEKLIYYVVEAFDQPWKIEIEGTAGAYWGVFNVDREPKFPMEGDVLANPTWRNWASGAALLSIILMAAFLFTRKSLKLPGKLFFGIVANLAASVLFWSASIAAAQYQTGFSVVFWAILLMMQAMAILVLLTESLEIAEVLWHRKGRRTFTPLTPPTDFRYPKVSIHLPIHNEPPEMVRKTLNALAKVDYPNFEVLVMDNNTKDPAVWRPVRDDCDRLGAKFRFFHLDNWPGYKAGAINYALENTAEDAEIIAVIDSDYILSPDWLKAMVPYFDQENVGFVQSPQDYRDSHQSSFKNMCYWEYAGFFNIGMVQRNEYNAIIQHGTMTMIRKSAFEKVGPWGEWCICEDSELGLRLYEAGYDSVYCKESFGRGLMPDTFSGYMTQRFRWVYGAMQIIKQHWRHFLPNKKSSLTSAQRYYFVAGWLPWFSDALALLFTGTSLVLTALLLYDPKHSELPVNAFLLPTIGLFAFKILRGLWLYKARVACSLWQALGAALAGLSLTHTVARGTLQGLFTSGKPFMRTPKYEQQGPLVAGLLIIWQELLLLILLLAGAVAMRMEPQFDNLSGRLWVAVLVVQSVPYIATFLTILISVAPNYIPGQKLSADEMDAE